MLNILVHLEVQRQIIHIDQDAFFVSVELLKNPSLVGKPVIVGGSSDRGVVTSCSYEARKFGVRSAMPSKQARQLCPEAIFVKGSMEDYSRYSGQITQILRERVPVLEKASIDEHYIDMSGMDRFHNIFQFASELREYVTKQTGLPLSFGLSVNKTLAKMATNACKPNGRLHVPAGEVRAFLDPMCVSKIPGLGKSTFSKLKELGIRTIGQLATAQEAFINKNFGKHGASLLNKARGIDHSPVVPWHEQKSMGSQRTFRLDTDDVTGIHHLLTALVTDLAFELRSKGKLTSCITLTLRYSNFDTYSYQSAIPFTSMDAYLIKKAKELFDKSYDKKRKLRLAGVRLSGLVNGFEQLDLYNESAGQFKLYQAMDRIRNKFGDRSVFPAAAIDVRL